MTVKTPTLARSAITRLSLMVLTATIAACAGDGASAPSPTLHTQDATKALVGIVDGTYVVTLDPRYDQVLSAGPNSLVVPANSICALGTSGYSPSYWNSPCTPETMPVTITAISPSERVNRIKFQPAGLVFEKAATLAIADAPVRATVPRNVNRDRRAASSRVIRPFTPSSLLAAWRQHLFWGSDDRPI